MHVKILGSPNYTHKSCNPEGVDKTTDIMAKQLPAPTESPVSPSKSVKFADQNQVLGVLRRRSQFSRQSIANIWFQGDDFEDFIDDIEKSVDKMESGKRLKDKKYSSLGLEGLTEEGSALRQAYKEDAWDAVLWEQHYQREDGRRSSLEIAQGYRDVSMVSQLRALETALKVHRECLKFYTDESMVESETIRRISDHGNNHERPMRR